MTAIKPRWANYREASRYSGIHERMLQQYVADGLVSSSLVCKPGAKRGVRLIDLRSLDAFIEQGIGGKVELKMNTERKVGAR